MMRKINISKTLEKKMSENRRQRRMEKAARQVKNNMPTLGDEFKLDVAADAADIVINLKQVERERREIWDFFPRRREEILLNDEEQKKLRDACLLFAWTNRERTRGVTPYRLLHEMLALAQWTCMFDVQYTLSPEVDEFINNLFINN